MTDPCVDSDHFDILDGVIAPQPWMQWRQVATVAAASKAGSYAVSGGGNKNDVLHSLSVAWTNNSPLPQWVYGLVTRGGSRVTLQARSRGYLQLFHGLGLGLSAPALVEVSRMGTGADIGTGGLLGIGGSFCIVEHRQNSVTMPLLPETVGWLRVEPAQSVTGRCELRFKSDNWESSSISGGSSGAESSYVSGDSRIDLFAVPIIE